MATINSVTFNLTGIMFSSNNRNILGRSPGSSTNPITNFGMDGLEITVSGWESTQSDYDSVVNAFVASGSRELIIRTGWKYDIYSTSNNINEVGGFADNYFPYRFDLITSDPYQYSTPEITRSKTITTNNQEWSADDSANDITTTGTVGTVPDIKVTGGAATADYNRIESTYEEAGGASGGFTYDYEVVFSYTYPAKLFSKYYLDEVYNTFTYSTGSYKITYQFGAGAETTIADTVMTTTRATHSADVTGDVNEALVINFYAKYNAGTQPAYTEHGLNGSVKRTEVSADIEVFNTADEDVGCEVGNVIYTGMIVLISQDGTGHIDLEDDYTSDKYLDICHDGLSVTYDDANDKLTIADDGYLIYKVDCKYPITGTPTLTAQIDTTAGTPTLQVAKDDGAGEPDTWYDIDTAIVDDVETEYELVSGTDIVFKGETVVFVRLDCVKTDAATLSIKSLDYDFDIVTIDAENPVINTGAANTFRCDQGATSSLGCTVELKYRNRKWAA